MLHLYELHLYGTTTTGTHINVNAALVSVMYNHTEYLPVAHTTHNHCYNYIVHITIGVSLLFFTADVSHTVHITTAPSLITSQVSTADIKAISMINWAPIDQTTSRESSASPNLIGDSAVHPVCDH